MAVGVLALLAVAATPVLASHAHVVQLGGGHCLLTASNGGEDAVTLPLVVSSTIRTSTSRRCRTASTRSTSRSTRACPATTARSRLRFTTPAAPTLCQNGIADD